MRRSFLALLPFLLAEASENPDGGGAPVTPPVPPASPPVTPPAESQGGALVPSLLDHALAVGKGKADLMASVRDLGQKNGTLTADLARIGAERDTLAARVVELEAERAQIQAALTAAETSAKTVEQSTTQALAALNIPRSELPAPGAQHGGGTKLEQLNAQLAAATDPKERGRLSVQIWDEMKAAAKK